MKLIKKQLTTVFFLCLFAVLTIESSSAIERVTYMHNDELGSSVAATDSSGKVLWIESYRPYGERIEKKNKDSNESWYTGKQHDADIGLSYYGARWYDPNVGRFTGIDPIGVPVGDVHLFNRYAYANNNPYKYNDPNGENPLGVLASYYGETIGIAGFYWVSKISGDSIGVRVAEGNIGASISRGTQSLIDDFSNPENLVLNRIGGKALKSYKKSRAPESIINDREAKKIFGSREGHLPDTPQNRKLLQGIANDPKTTLGPDKHGTIWSGKILENGTQVWTQTWKGKITNGGVNQTPHTYNKETGLAKRNRPNWK